MNTRAISHILTHSMDYEKPKEGRRALARILGNGTPPASHSIWSELIKYGVLVAEGNVAGNLKSENSLTHYLY